MRENYEHERDRRYALTDSVRRHRKDRDADRAKDRGDCASAQLLVERDVRSLVDEMATASRAIHPSNGKVTSLRVQNDHLELERKNLMEIIERGAIFIVGRRLVLTVRVETPHENLGYVRTLRGSPIM